MYNGTILCEPSASVMSKLNTRPYQGQDFQLTFTPSANCRPPALPQIPIQSYKIDGGFGIQGWRTDKKTPVLWTEWSCQEGLVLRQEIFAHMKGGGDVKVGNDPLYAWVRLSVSHVDEIRAPQKFGFAVQVSKIYFKHFLPRKCEDSVTLQANPALAKMKSPLKQEVINQGQETGLRILQEDGKVRLLVLPGSVGSVGFSETANDSQIYALKVELPVKLGAYVDMLGPTLPETVDQLAKKLISDLKAR